MLGYFGTSTNIQTTVGLTNETSYFIGSITIPVAGTYLITAQAGAQNGGGGTTTNAAFYMNNNTAGAGVPPNPYGPTGTIMFSSLPYSNLGTGGVIANLSNIVKITASTTFDFFGNIKFTGNCQSNAPQTYINYVRIG